MCYKHIELWEISLSILLSSSQGDSVGVDSVAVDRVVHAPVAIFLGAVAPVVGVDRALASKRQSLLPFDHLAKGDQLAQHAGGIEEADELQERTAHADGSDHLQVILDDLLQRVDTTLTRE